MTHQILALSGSLRAASVNTALLHSVGLALPDGVDLQIYDYSAIPLFNSDIETPPAVTKLKAAITQADAVLIATPEYNYSVPGVLKNAIDWASRPAYKSPFLRKPTAVISAAASFVGGARAQQHMKTILLGMGSQVWAGPELLVGSALGKVQGGEIVEPKTLEHIQRFALAFADWTSDQRRS